MASTQLCAVSSAPFLRTSLIIFSNPFFGLPMLLACLKVCSEDKSNLPAHPSYQDNTFISAGGSHIL
jgi:hypothetical protein